MLAGRQSKRRKGRFTTLALGWLPGDEECDLKLNSAAGLPGHILLPVLSQYLPFLSLLFASAWPSKVAVCFFVLLWRTGAILTFCSPLDATLLLLPSRKRGEFLALNSKKFLALRPYHHCALKLAPLGGCGCSKRNSSSREGGSART